MTKGKRIKVVMEGRRKDVLMEVKELRMEVKRIRTDLKMKEHGEDSVTNGRRAIGDQRSWRGQKRRS